MMRIMQADMRVSHLHKKIDRFIQSMPLRHPLPNFQSPAFAGLFSYGRSFDPNTLKRSYLAQLDMALDVLCAAGTVSSDSR